MNGLTAGSTIAKKRAAVSRATRVQAFWASKLGGPWFSKDLGISGSIYCTYLTLGDP